jgi:hypothetical protein
MGKGRLEAFSDGVIAIIITIMVLELRAPHEPSPAALRPLVPIFISYLMSFVFLGIYWSNHHHLLQAVHRVDGRVLWANLHLLFWLSLTPFVTSWMGESHFAAWPVAAYGAVLLLASVAYFVLTRVSREGFRARQGGGKRPEGNAVDADLRGGPADRVSGAPGRFRDVRSGCPDLADPRPQDRTDSFRGRAVIHSARTEKDAKEVQR